MAAHAAATEMVVIGASAGGLHALRQVLSGLPKEFPAAVLVVQHRQANIHDMLAALLGQACQLPVREAVDKAAIQAGHVLLAPANYHLLVEIDRRLALSVDGRVSFSRPSVDVLFESAAEAFGSHVVGVLLTGANHDGVAGLRKIKACGGITLAQDPQTAEAATMPQAAIDAEVVNHVLALNAIAPFLIGLYRDRQNDPA